MKELAAGEDYESRGPGALNTFFFYKQNKDKGE
jgi:hypothetical protein